MGKEEGEDKGKAEGETWVYFFFYSFFNSAFTMLFPNTPNWEAQILPDSSLLFSILQEESFPCCSLSGICS